MENFFRDSIWQFYGTLLAFIGILEAIIIYLLQRKRKLLNYSLSVEFPILPTNEVTMGELKGMGYAILTVYLIQIKNNGNQPILASDFESPIQIRFDEDAEIISAELIESMPTYLAPVITIERPNLLSINSLLLNQKDYFIIKIVLPKLRNKIELKTRIAGVKSLTKAPFTDKRSKIVLSFYYLNAPSMLLTIIFALLVNYGYLDPHSFISIIIEVFIFLIFSYSIFFVIKNRSIL